MTALCTIYFFFWFVCLQMAFIAAQRSYTQSKVLPSTGLTINEPWNRSKEIGADGVQFLGLRAALESTRPSIQWLVRASYREIEAIV
jgi:hypothetical protein